MKERAEQVKAYIEKKYQKMKTEEQERKEGNHVRLIELAWDKLNHKMEELQLSKDEQDLIKNDIIRKEAELNRKM